MLSLNTSRAREEEPFVEGGVHVSPKVGLTSRHLQGQPQKPHFPSIVCGCDALQPILAIPFQSGSASCAWYLLILSGPKVKSTKITIPHFTGQSCLTVTQSRFEGIQD
jgi:hypothetical protein